MPDPEPLSLLSPFQPRFLYDPSPNSPMEQGHEGRNQLSAVGRLPPWQALQADLGIPQDCDIYLFDQWWPLARRVKPGQLKGQWRGFYFEVVATFAQDDNDWPQAPPFWLHSPPDRGQQGYTARTEDRYDGLPTARLIAWRRRVVYQHAPPWLEAQWHPDTGVRIALLGLEQAVERAHIHEVLRGLRLLRRLEKGGRHPGPAGFRDVHEFEHTLALMIREIHANSMDPTVERIATLLRPMLARRRRDTGSPASVETNIDSTKRLIRKHLSCPWPDFVKRVLQQP